MNVNILDGIRDVQLRRVATTIFVNVLMCVVCVTFAQQSNLPLWEADNRAEQIQKPPVLSQPQRGEQIPFSKPFHIVFRWKTYHREGMDVEYEFILKELPENNMNPQSAYTRGVEVFRTTTQQSSLHYTHLEPALQPHRRYGWQVRVISSDRQAVANNGFSDVNWFTVGGYCPAPGNLTHDIHPTQVELSWMDVPEAKAYVVSYRSKGQNADSEWTVIKVYGESVIIPNLTPGETYQWQVGTLCDGDRPIFAPFREFTVPPAVSNTAASVIPAMKAKKQVKTELQEKNGNKQAADSVAVAETEQRSLASNKKAREREAALAKLKAEQEKKKTQQEVAAKAETPQNKEPLPGKKDVQKAETAKAEVPTKAPAEKKQNAPERDVAASKEGVSLSNFASNRGKLPVPVTGKYSIVSSFGTHQQGKHVTTNSNGIDIQTQSGANARAVFGGEVSRVVSFPGFNTCVIIRHGDYYTFYGNIQNVRVRQGQSVKMWQNIGRVFTDPDSGVTKLHFQLWNGTNKQNPMPWLKK